MSTNESEYKEKLWQGFEALKAKFSGAHLTKRYSKFESISDLLKVTFLTIENFHVLTHSERMLTQSELEISINDIEQLMNQLNAEAQYFLSLISKLKEINEKIHRNINAISETEHTDERIQEIIVMLIEREFQNEK